MVFVLVINQLPLKNSYGFYQDKYIAVVLAMVHQKSNEIFVGMTELIVAQGLEQKTVEITCH